MLLLARLLDERHIGFYFIVLLVIFLLKIISDFGIDLSFVKLYADKNTDDQNVLFTEALILRVLICTAVSFIYLTVESSGYIDLIQEISHSSHWILLLYWAHSLRELLLRTLQASYRFAAYAKALVSSAALKLCFFVFLSKWADVNLSSVLFFELVAVTVSLMFCIFSIQSVSRLSPNISTNGMKRILGFGFPLYLNSFLNLGNEKVTEYIVASTGGPIAMAFFGISSRLADAGTHMFSAFANVYLPTQTNNFSNDRESDAVDLANRSLTWVSYLCCTVIVGFSVFSVEIITLIFTERYSAVSSAVLMFFGVLLFRSLHTIMGYFAIAGGHKYLPMRVSFFSSLFNIAMSIQLFQHFGYQGAVAAILLTQAIMSAIYFVLLRRLGYHLHIAPVIYLAIGCLISVVAIHLIIEWALLKLFVLILFSLSSLALIPQLRSDIHTLAGDQYLENFNYNSVLRYLRKSLAKKE